MVKMLISNVKQYCPSCNKAMDIPNRSFQVNPFCSDRVCYEKRLENSGAVDLRDNVNVIDLANGYAELVPLDTNKKFQSRGDKQ